MGWSEILACAFVATLLVVSPGPNGMLITKTVPTSGKTAGTAASLMLVVIHSLRRTGASSAGATASRAQYSSGFAQNSQPTAHDV